MADDISGLPDVDLSGVVSDLESQHQDKEPAATKAPDTELDLGQFKNPKDLLKSYKEIQGAFTRVTQENKATKEELAALRAEAAALKEQQELARYSNPSSQGTPKKFDDAWMDDPEQAIAQKVAEQVNLARIQDVLEQEDFKDHASFQERYSYVNMLSQNPQYAHLSRTAGGVKKLFEIGDKLRTEQLKKSAGIALESIFGEPLGPEEINRLKTLVKGSKTSTQTPNTNAYMPDIDTSTMTGAEQNQKPSYDTKMTEAVKKGDVDGTIDALFEGILAE